MRKGEAMQQGQSEGATNWAGVKLGPALPMPVFTSSERWNPERIHALALYCSDGRWGEAFDEFCQRRLLLPRYDRLAVPGGPAWLLPRKTGRDLSQTTREQLGLLVRVHELEQIILISHYGCAFYAEMFGKDPEGCLPVQLQEMRDGKALLRQWFPALNVEAYLAMRHAESLTFHALVE
jgi:hypothetical protein